MTRNEITAVSKWCDNNGGYYEVWLAGKGKNTFNTAQEVIDFLIKLKEAGDKVPDDVFEELEKEKEYEPVESPRAWFIVDEINEWATRYPDKHPDPEPRQWQGLSLFEQTHLRTTHAPLKELYYDKEIDCSVCAEVVTDWDSFFAAIEAKLKEKNHG